MVSLRPTAPLRSFNRSIKLQGPRRLPSLLRDALEDLLRPQEIHATQPPRLIDVGQARSILAALLKRRDTRIEELGPVIILVLRRQRNRKSLVDRIKDVDTPEAFGTLSNDWPFVEIFDVDLHLRDHAVG